MAVDTLLGAVLVLATALPLAWKWELGLRRVVPALLAVCASCGLLLAAAGPVLPDAAQSPLTVWALSLTVAGAFLLYRFYRDPERVAPDRSDAILSPADGRVLYVRRSAGGRLPASAKNGREYMLEELTKTPLAAGEAVIVGIALSFLDVHVNRAPIGGTVVASQKHSGAFRSLKHPQSLLENERATTVIERDGRQVAVVLIASRLVRRIVSLVREGDRVACGQRIGAIRFGSQVDLVLPAEWGAELQVGVGERVSAGESIVAVIRQSRALRERSVEGGATAAANADARR